MSRSPHPSSKSWYALILAAAVAVLAAPALGVPVNLTANGTGSIWTHDTITGLTPQRFDEATAFQDGAADLDALWVNTGTGTFVFSTAQTETMNAVGGGTITFRDEDLILWNENTLEASLFHDFTSVFVGNEDINALHVLANGNYLISTTNTSVINGFTIQAEDVVEYDPTTFQVVQTVFDGSAIIGANEVIDGVQVTASGRLVISTTNNFSLLSGGPTYDDDDVVIYNPVSGTLSLWLDVGGLVGNGGVDVNAFHVPEPRFAMLVLGLLGLAAAGRRRS